MVGRMDTEVALLEVDVRYNVYAEAADVLAKSPDHVLLKTGTEPLAEVFYELAEGASNKGISDVDAMAN